MVQVEDSELVALIAQAIDRYVSSSSVNPGNVCQSVAEIIVHALHRAGTVVVRDEAREPSTAAVIAFRRSRPAPG
jgi:hypothetical protein